MKYMLLLYANEGMRPQYSPEQFQAVTGAWDSIKRDAEAAGVLVSAHGLTPIRDAISLRMRSGCRVVKNGVYTTTMDEEHLTGYYILECGHLEEAIDWAARIPLAEYGTIQIRPLESHLHGETRPADTKPAVVD